MTPLATAASFGGAAVGAGLFVRECQKRAKQLSRIEKELNAERLPIRLPTNLLAEMPFSKPYTLQELRSSKVASSYSGQPPRIIAVCGTRDTLKDALSGLAVYGQRLTQASALVVPVSTDGTSSNEWKVLDESCYRSWLADAYQPNLWLEYFEELSNDVSSDAEATTTSPTKADFRWFGLTARGQSWGSGFGEIPQWLQVLGQYLRPTDFLDAPGDLSESDKSSVNQIETELLENVQTFYKALTTGDEEGMDRIYSKSFSREVSEVMEAGGRIDTWKDCLAEGARPSDMKVSGIDVTIVSETQAFTTVIEFPANIDMDSATLLAVQRWTRATKDESWKLELHQTIPWSLETKAQGTLRCDCRGCVALTRSPERRTFGGIIG